MSNETRWVVVGYGMGWHHARFLEAVDGLALHGVCDVLPERLDKALREHPGIKTYARIEDVLADDAVDGVVVVTPHNTHASLAIKAMNAGKHTITDKAMCLSVAEAEAMIRARDENGVLLSVFQNRRWDGDFVSVRKVISDYELGRLYHIQSCVTYWGAPGGWRADRAVMGGWLFDWGAHTLDQILLLTGSAPKQVHAIAHYRYTNASSVEDYIQCTVVFENGITATTIIGYINLLPMPRWYVIGEFGALDCQTFETPVRVRKIWDGKENEREIPPVPSDWEAFYRNIADYFAGRAELAVRPEQIVPQIAISEAAYRSVETGQVIHL